MSQLCSSNIINREKNCTIIIIINSYNYTQVYKNKLTIISIKYLFHQT